MKRATTMLTFTLCGLIAWGATGRCDEVPAKRVLAIGIDGVRPDTLAKAATPHLDELIEQGSYADTTQILGPRYQKNDTISGPGWSSYLTGVWADKHGAHDNSFEGKMFAQYPHFFARLKQQFPGARTASFVNWEPIDTHIVTHADVRLLYSPEDDDFALMDARIAREASTFLAEDDPHAIMVYFGNVDAAGHGSGFHPTVSQYVQAIEQADRHVGALMASLKARTNYEQEDWLILVSTDHGGKGTSHSDGHGVPEICTIFLIVSGPSAKQGRLESPTYVVDLPVTALVHLGVQLDPAWQLDGKAVGLREQ